MQVLYAIENDNTMNRIPLQHLLNSKFVVRSQKICITSEIVKQHSNNRKYINNAKRIAQLVFNLISDVLVSLSHSGRHSAPNIVRRRVRLVFELSPQFLHLPPNSHTPVMSEHRGQPEGVLHVTGTFRRLLPRFFSVAVCANALLLFWVTAMEARNLAAMDKGGS
jgi:hypothetical protein